MRLGHEAWNDTAHKAYYTPNSPQEVSHSQLSIAGYGLVLKLFEKATESPGRNRDIALHGMSTELKTPTRQLMRALEELEEAEIVKSDRKFRHFNGCGWRIYLPVPDAYEKPHRPGYVYAMHNVETNLVKIGRTKFIDERHASLAKEHRLDLESLRVIGLSFVSDCHVVESQFHRKFTRDRVAHTEWFDLTHRLENLSHAISQYGFYNYFQPEGIVL